MWWLPPWEGGGFQFWRKVAEDCVAFKSHVAVFHKLNRIWYLKQNEAPSCESNNMNRILEGIIHKNWSCLQTNLKKNILFFPSFSRVRTSTIRKRITFYLELHAQPLQLANETVLLRLEFISILNSHSFVQRRCCRETRQGHREGKQEYSIQHYMCEPMRRNTE